MTEADGAWTIQKVLTWSTDFLKERNRSATPRLDAEILLAHALSVPRLHLYTHFDKPLSVGERGPFKQFLMRRGGGEPVAYITGTKEFMGLSFAVSSAVLIPRPDTEVVVETALAELRSASAPRILDVGTGSGCIAVALAVRLHDAVVDAWDVDEGALALAAVNAASHGVSRIAFQRQDALEASAWTSGEAYDLIISNPPYIAVAEEPALPDSVVKFEPKGALFAAEDGLAFYRRFGDSAAARLAPGGRMVLEIGATQGPTVQALLEASGWDVAIKKDYAKLDRVIVAARAAEGRF